MIRYKSHFMKKTSIFLLILLALLPLTSQGQPLARYQDQIYQSYITGEISSWESTLWRIEKLYQQQPSAEVLYNLLLTRYGITGYYLGNGQKDKAREQINAAQQELELLERHEDYKSRRLALRGAFLGFRIALSPIRSVVLGPRSMNAVDEALQADPGNPTAHLEKGNVLYYAPGMFGGSKEKAIEHYQKALQLMEQQQNAAHRWLALSTRVALAKAYEETGDPQRAIEILQETLTIEPRFQWVKNELLPQLLQKQ